jgi:hypothetical protein
VPPRLSAVICSFSRYHVLAGAIESLRGQTLNDGFVEIIVVDNSADQAAAAEFGAAYRDVANFSYVCEPVVGLSNARNVALARARAPVVGFIDDDAVAGPGWAQAILDAFGRYGARAGAVGGLVRPRWSVPRPAWLGDDLLNQLAVIDWGPAMHETRPERGIVGCNMALDRALALGLGGFSGRLGRSGPEHILLSNEESALVARIRAAGRAIIYAPDAVVEHVISAERLTQNWFRRRAAWQAISDYIVAPEEAAGRAAAFSAACRAASGGGLESDDPVAFSAAFWMAYHATLAALVGGELPLAMTAGWRIKRRIKDRVLVFTQKRPGVARLCSLGLRGVRRLRGRG